MSRFHRLRHHALPRRIRWRILNRADFCCEKCGRRGRALEVDHVIPLSEGGTSDPDNLQALCRDCHLAKTRRENGGARGANEWEAFARRRRQRSA